jgi:phosphomannomutase/phosphoglucomutase
MNAKHSAVIDPSIFRAYDIRGIVGTDLTEENVYLIGKAIGSLARERHQYQIVIARDGRVSGPALSAALCEGILSTGCDVVDLGMVPTPLLYYATHQLDQRSGVMLTGSHNPANYNGLKMVIDGVTLTADDITGLYTRIIEKRFNVGQGSRQELDVVRRYIDEITAGIKLAKSLKIVIDAGNGITGVIAPYLFRALGCDVHELYCDVDGAFPNHHPDPSQPENLQALKDAVQATQADIGLAFDGDGDRLGVVTNKGNIIWPDRLLMLFAKAVLAETPNAKIVFDVKCTNHLAPLIASLGGEAIMWKTGHSFIKAKIAETKAQLAGEMSGHFFFSDRWYGFDDALYAGARLMEILSREQVDSDTVFAAIPNSINTPELKLPVAESDKFSLMQRLIDNAQFTEAHEVMTIDGLRVNFADGWGLIRPSNTTPYLVLRFEAVNDVFMEKMQMMFREWLLSVEGDLALPF